MVSFFKAGDAVDRTYVLDFDNVSPGELNRKSAFTVDTFEGAGTFGAPEDDLFSKEDPIKSLFLGGSQHFGNDGDGSGKDLRDIAGSHLRGDDVAKLLAMAKEGTLTDVAGLSNVSFVQNPVDPELGFSLRFDVETGLARDGGTGATNTIVINVGDIGAGGFGDEGGPLETDLPDIGAAFTDTINRTNIDGADFSVEVVNDDELLVSITTPGLDGITVQENVGDRFLFGNQATVGDDTVSDLRSRPSFENVDGERVQTADNDIEGSGVPSEFGFGGFITANEVIDLVDQAGEGGTVTFSDLTDGDRLESFDFDLTFTVPDTVPDTESEVLL